MLHVATENSSVVIYSEQLIPILLKAFDLRRIHYTTRTQISFTDWEVAGIEEILFDSTITMIHKFSDHTFRPVFLRLWKWTSNSIADSAKIYRQITFYAFLAKFFNSLRVKIVDFLSPSTSTAN